MASSTETRVPGGTPWMAHSSSDHETRLECRSISQPPMRAIRPAICSSDSLRRSFSRFSVRSVMSCTVPENIKRPSSLITAFPKQCTFRTSPSGRRKRYMKSIFRWPRKIASCSASTRPRSSGSTNAKTPTKPKETTEKQKKPTYRLDKPRMPRPSARHDANDKKLFKLDSLLRKATIAYEMLQGNISAGPPFELHTDSHN